MSRLWTRAVDYIRGKLTANRGYESLDSDQPSTSTAADRGHYRIEAVKRLSARDQIQPGQCVANWLSWKFPIRFPRQMILHNEEIISIELVNQTDQVMSTKVIIDRVYLKPVNSTSRRYVMGGCILPRESITMKLQANPNRDQLAGRPQQQLKTELVFKLSFFVKTDSPVTMLHMLKHWDKLDEWRHSGNEDGPLQSIKVPCLLVRD